MFEVLGDKSPVGVYIVQDEEFCYINTDIQSFTGWRNDELLVRDWLELVIPEDRDMVRENAMKKY